MVFQEGVEAKQKVTKRNTKSEELLEYTLKYQKVMLERDAG